MTSAWRGLGPPVGAAAVAPDLACMERPKRCPEFSMQTRCFRVLGCFAGLVAAVGNRERVGQLFRKGRSVFLARRAIPQNSEPQTAGSRESRIGWPIAVG
jgi:hypothetical protein